MEKLTIERIGQEKEVKTKFGLKKKTGVIFKEYPNIWHDTWLSGLKEGQVLEGTRESREWEGKTYWNFNLPKKDEVNAKANEEILGKLATINLKIDQIIDYIKNKNKPADGVDYPENNDGEIPF